MLDANGIDQYYGGSHTLRGVSLSVRQGECLALLGYNGVGKTTLLKCLMGVLPVARGGVSLDGADITRLAPHQRAARGMAYVPQGRDIFARLTVEENILMGMATKPAARAAHQGGSVRAVPRAARHAVAARRRSVGRTAATAGDRAGAGGRARLIILDEPTEGIQPSIIKDIGRVIRMLRQRGDIGILLCEQYFDFARELADRYMVLSRGEVVASGGRETMDGEDVRRHLSV